jgi:putative ABC transport system permease protein
MTEKKPQPLAWMFRFLQWFCPPHLLEEIEGDLIERFERNAKLMGRQKALRKLFWSILRFFRPGIILRNKFSARSGFLVMLPNYFKVSGRLMIRNKTFSVINISGLVLGMTAALLLALWILHEASYDQFHRDKDRLYVIWNRAKENNEVNCWSVTPRVLATTLAKDYTAVENVISYADWDATHLFTVGEKKLIKSSGIFTDKEFFQILSFPLLKGNPSTVFNEPASIVLTEKFSRELFGDQEPFGESLSISQSGYTFEFTVTGILQDLPPNTDYKFDYLIPFGFLESLGEKDTFWGNNSVQTLVKLREGTDADLFNAQIKDLKKKNDVNAQHIELFLYPLNKMRLYSRFENGQPAGGRVEVMRLLGLLGIFLVIIACINFINLYTARAQRRTKEIAIRKITGARRLSLITQFMCESTMIAVLAGGISLAAAYLLLPYFSGLVEQDIKIDFGNTQFWMLAGLLSATVGVIAGSYPSFYLSSFHPIRILKGISFAGRNTFRSSLVVFQFGFALTLIVSALVISKQIGFVQQRDAGYSPSNLIHLPLSGDLAKNFQAFSNDLLQSGAAVSITKTSAPITEQWSGTTEMKWKGKDPQDKSDIQRIYVDQKMVTTAELQIIEGRDLDLEQFPSDSLAVLLNETALAVMQFENPVGEIIEDAGRQWHGIGVVKDFVFTSPFHKIEPIVLFGGKMKEALNVVYIRLNTSNKIQHNLSLVAAASAKYNREYPFEYQFADAEYGRKFDNINSTLRLTALFTAVAIFIACLGLFGLAVYMSESRLKEIGIRKAMGGSTFSITKLLSYSSLKPILISVLIFTPLSWMAMNWWLQSFAYRTSIDIWIFVISALSILLIALITVSTQTIKAARTNPVISLRSE